MYSPISLSAWGGTSSRRASRQRAAVRNSEDMLFMLYTSGSTGKPKGVVHTCGGYMVYTCFSFRNVFQYNDGDIYWCTADIGWITGHSYIVYGPLLAGATTMMFEGVIIGRRHTLILPMRPVGAMQSGKGQTCSELRRQPDCIAHVRIPKRLPSERKRYL